MGASGCYTLSKACINSSSISSYRTDYFRGSEVWYWRLQIRLNCTPNENEPDVFISNYEQLDNIDCSVFAGIVLDESSILKNFTGVYKNKIIELFKNTPYKLACTATPSPNDLNEIRNHSEFLDILDSWGPKLQFC